MSKAKSFKSAVRRIILYPHSPAPAAPNDTPRIDVDVEIHVQHDSFVWVGKLRIILYPHSPASAAPNDTPKI